MRLILLRFQTNILVIYLFYLSTKTYFEYNKTTICIWSIAAAPRMQCMARHLLMHVIPNGHVCICVFFLYIPNTKPKRRLNAASKSSLYRMTSHQVILSNTCRLIQILTDETNSKVIRSIIMGNAPCRMRDRARVQSICGGVDRVTIATHTFDCRTYAYGVFYFSSKKLWPHVRSLSLTKVNCYILFDVLTVGVRVVLKHKLYAREWF